MSVFAFFEDAHLLRRRSPVTLIFSKMLTNTVMGGAMSIFALANPREAGAGAPHVTKAIPLASCPSGSDKS